MDWLDFLEINAALVELLAPDNEWREQQIGVCVTRCPLDFDNNPIDRIKPNYARLLDETGAAVSGALKAAMGVL
jgi:hypothetical protein